MRWLMIAFLVSLAALLLAAAGSTIHIWVQRARLRCKSSADAGAAPEPAEDADQETEI